MAEAGHATMSHADDRDENTEEQQQEARAELRKRYLRVLNSLSGKTLRLRLHGRNDDLAGVFRASSATQQHFHLQNFKTPIGVQPEALIRTTDIMYCKSSWRNATNMTIDVNNK